MTIRLDYKEGKVIWKHSLQELSGALYATISSPHRKCRICEVILSEGEQVYLTAPVWWWKRKRRWSTLRRAKGKAMVWGNCSIFCHDCRGEAPPRLQRVIVEEVVEDEGGA